MNIFERMRAGGIIPHTDPAWAEVWEIVNQMVALSTKLNASGNVEEIRTIYPKFWAKPLILRPPF